MRWHNSSAAKLPAHFYWCHMRPGTTHVLLSCKLCKVFPLPSDFWLQLGLKCCARHVPEILAGGRSWLWFHPFKSIDFPQLYDCFSSIFFLPSLQHSPLTLSSLCLRKSSSFKGATCWLRFCAWMWNAGEPTALIESQLGEIFRIFFEAIAGPLVTLVQWAVHGILAKPQRIPMREQFGDYHNMYAPCGLRNLRRESSRL